MSERCQGVNPKITMVLSGVLVGGNSLLPRRVDLNEYHDEFPEEVI